MKNLMKVFGILKNKEIIDNLNKSYKERSKLRLEKANFKNNLKLETW